MTKIINLTPHPINIVGLGEIKPSGKPARLEERTEMVGSITVTATENPNIKSAVVIPLIRKVFGKITDLPEPQYETIFLVSLPVAQAAHRSDVLAIGESIRDVKGNIVGAKSLAMF
jgi:hypothetical protein